MANPPDLLIYGMKGSPFVRKVQVFLAEKGEPFEIEMTNIFPASAEYAAIHPGKRIPTLRDRSVGREGVAGTIPDSSAICAYLERKHPEPALYPSDPFEYGRALWLEEYADGDVAARAAGGVFRVTVVQKLLGKEPDVERARKTVREEMPAVFDYLEGAIGEREYLVGDRFSIADISVATQFVNYFHAGAPIDAGRWPNFAAYIERIHGRPAFKEPIAEERAMLPNLNIEY